MSKKTKGMIKVGLLMMLVLSYFFIPPLQTFIKRVIFLFAMVDVSAIRGYILSFGIWAPVVSFLLMIFQSLVAPLPAFLITFANAAMFGWVKGALLSWSSAMVGATLCFLIARFYGRDAVGKLTNKLALKKVDEFFNRHGQYAILIARLLPFVSFDVVSYAAGLTSISFWQFFWATGLGQLPATLVYSFVGGMMGGAVKMVVTGLLMVFSLSVLALLLKSVMREKQDCRIKPEPANDTNCVQCDQEHLKPS